MPSVFDIHEALISLEAEEQGATLGAVRCHPSLLALVTEAANDFDVTIDQLARESQALLREACETLGSNPPRYEAAAASHLLGLADGSRSAPPHVRRRVAAERLDMLVNTFLKHPGPRSRARWSHKDRLLLSVAEALDDLALLRRVDKGWAARQVAVPLSWRGPASVVGWAPGMVDINLESRLPTDNYLQGLVEIGVRPGDWQMLGTLADLDDACRTLGGRSLTSLVDDPSAVEAGSTIAGSFAAFSPELQLARVLNVYFGSKSDPIGHRLLDILSAHGLRLTPRETAGHVDVCLAAFHRDVPERVMLVAYGLQRPEEPVGVGCWDRALHVISAFELERGFFVLDEEALLSAGGRVALGLGDKSILAGPFRTRILALLRSGVVRYVFGDIAEYVACFLGEPARTGSPDIVKVMTVLSKRMDCVFLITAGAEGSYACSAGELAFVPGSHIVGLVNTNGAGDAAAGGFMSAHLAGADLRTALENGMKRAEAILQVPGALPPVAQRRA